MSTKQAIKSKKKLSEDIEKKRDKDIIPKTQALVEGKHALFSCESVIFCVDCSGSMRSKKLDTLKDCFRKYIERKMMSCTADKDKVGIVAFPGPDSLDCSDESTPSEETDMWDELVPDNEIELGGAGGVASVDYHCRSSHSYPTGIKVISELTMVAPIMVSEVNKMRAEGGTPMGTALIKAGQMLSKNAVGLARIVIMSDGEPNEGMRQPAIVAKAKQLYDLEGIIIDTVAICMGESYVDKEFMKRVANAGGGQYTVLNVYADFERYLDATESERKDLLGSGTLLLPGATT